METVFQLKSNVVWTQKNQLFTDVYKDQKFVQFQDLLQYLNHQYAESIKTEILKTFYSLVMLVWMILLMLIMKNHALLSISALQIKSV